MTVHTYDASEHKSWGDHISVLDWTKRRIHGHLQRPPEVGDRILFHMESGTTLETEVTDVEHMTDPPDQFFATVQDRP